MIAFSLHSIIGIAHTDASMKLKHIVFTFFGLLLPMRAAGASASTKICSWFKYECHEQSISLGSVPSPGSPFSCSFGILYGGVLAIVMVQLMEIWHVNKQKIKRPLMIIAGMIFLCIFVRQLTSLLYGTHSVHAEDMLRSAPGSFAAGMFFMMLPIQAYFWLQLLLIGIFQATCALIRQHSGEDKRHSSRVEPDVFVPSRRNIQDIKSNEGNTGVKRRRTHGLLQKHLQDLDSVRRCYRRHFSIGSEFLLLFLTLLLVASSNAFTTQTSSVLLKLCSGIFVLQTILSCVVSPIVLWNSLRTLRSLQLRARFRVILLEYHGIAAFSMKIYIVNTVTLFGMVVLHILYAVFPDVYLKNVYVWNWFHSMFDLVQIAMTLWHTEQFITSTTSRHLTQHHHGNPSGNAATSGAVLTSVAVIPNSAPVNVPKRGSRRGPGRTAEGLLGREEYQTLREMWAEQRAGSNIDNVVIDANRTVQGNRVAPMYLNAGVAPPHRRHSVAEPELSETEFVPMMRDRTLKTFVDRRASVKTTAASDRPPDMSHMQKLYAVQNILAALNSFLPFPLRNGKNPERT